MLGDGTGWSVVNLSSDIFASERFPPGIVMRHPRELVAVPELLDVQSEARALARTWHEALPEEVRAFNGVDLVAACEYDAMRQFVEALKGIRLAEAVVGERPESIVIVQDGSPIPRAFTVAAQHHGVVLRSFESHTRNRYHGSVPTPVTLRKALAAKAVDACVHAFARCRRRSATIRLLVTDYFRFDPLVDDVAADQRVQVYVLGGGRSKVWQDLTRPRKGICHPLLSARIGLRRLFSVGQYRQTTARIDREPVIRRGPHVRGYPLLEICRPWVDHLLSSALADYATFVDMATSLLKKGRVTHVLVDQDVQGERRLLSMIANRLGARTICYQHGMTVNCSFPAHVSDTYAAWGERERAQYQRLGRDTDRVRVLGDPFLAYLKTRRFDREAICRRIGLNPHRPIILMTCERYVSLTAPGEWPSLPNERLARVCDAVSGLPDVQLLVRFKGLGSYDEYGDSAVLKREIIDRFNRHGNICIDPSSRADSSGGNLYERLFISDAVIVTTSTVGLEAMLFGKSVLVLTEADAIQIVDYIDSGATSKVLTVEEIRSAITAAVDQTAPADALRDAQRRFVELNFANIHDDDPLSRPREFLFATASSSFTSPPSVPDTAAATASRA
jgi:hypothetical protein